MLRRSIVIATLLLTSGATWAQAEAEEVEGPWSGAASLGFLSTSGNTDTSSLNAGFDVGYAVNRWKHSLAASTISAETSSVNTAEAFQAGWKTEYNLTEFDFLFGTIDYRTDDFGGVDKQLTEALGYGRRLLDTPKHLLSAGLGIGHRSADLRDGTSESGAILRGNLDYVWTFTETAGFDQSFIVETGSDNTFIESISSVRAQLYGDLALVLSYIIRQNSDVPLGTEKTDRLSAVSIEYAF